MIYVAQFRAMNGGQYEVKWMASGPITAKAEAKEMFDGPRPIVVVRVVQEGPIGAAS